MVVVDREFTFRTGGALTNSAHPTLKAIKLPVLLVCDSVSFSYMLFMAVSFALFTFLAVMRCAPRPRMRRFAFTPFGTINTSFHSITR